MSITQNNQDIKIEPGMSGLAHQTTEVSAVSSLGRPFMIVTAIALVGIGYILGRISQKIEEKPVVVIKHERATQTQTVPTSGASVILSQVKESTLATTTPLYSGVVASRTGKKYHFPWCAGARSIKDTNKIWFDSESAARRAGYEPASNCKGLQ